MWNELHPIVLVKYKHSSISGRLPTGNEEIYMLFIFFVKEARTSYFRMSTQKVGKTLKKCV